MRSANYARRSFPYTPSASLAASIEPGAPVGVAAFVFLATLAATFFAAFLARRHAGGTADHGLAQRSLNRWLVGLSAGTTANSGFIVTGAVAWDTRTGCNGCSFH